MTERPRLLGIVNVTPDSFSDGGAHASERAAIDHGLRLLDEGADALDIGGESTRPGASPVSAEEELRRVLPVVRGLARLRPEVLLSIDTSKAVVAEAALGAGASMVNDVTALADPAMPQVCVEAEAQVVLMHLRGTPATMQQDTTYGDVVQEVCDHLQSRVEVALAAGVRPEHLLLDPGLGFGKALEHNTLLLAALPRLRALGYPVLIGASRKRFIGALTDVQEASERVYGSVGAALAAALRGAAYLRVHDVAATHQALTVFLAVEDAWTP